VSDGASSHTGGKPSLAVVVVNWNGCDLLDDCLGSLHADDLDLRVIMVDNGSHDDSVAHCREHHPQVDIIESPENLRWAGGNNLALRQLLQEGVPDGVLLLNNDTIVCKGALSRLMNVLTESGNWAATPRICYADSPEILWYEGGQVGRWTGWVSHRGIRKRAVDYPVERSATEYGTGCALLLSRHALEVVGLLDEDYFLYGEDTDYSLRLRQAGGTIVHEPAAVVLHKVSRTTGADSPRKAYMKSRSHMMLLRRHWSRSLWPVLIPSQIAFLGAQSLWQLFHGRAQTALAGVVGALDELSGRDDPS
jgi:GT2 family glycosyltransferase